MKTLQLKPVIISSIAGLILVGTSQAQTGWPVDHVACEDGAAGQQVECTVYGSTTNYDIVVNVSSSTSYKWASIPSTVTVHAGTNNTKFYPVLAETAYGFANVTASSGSSSKSESVMVMDSVPLH